MLLRPAMTVGRYPSRCGWRGGAFMVCPACARTCIGRLWPAGRGRQAESLRLRRRLFISRADRWVAWVPDSSRYSTSSGRTLRVAAVELRQRN